MTALRLGLLVIVPTLLVSACLDTSAYQQNYHSGMAGPFNEITVKSPSEARDIIHREKCVRLNYRTGVSHVNENGFVINEMRHIIGPIEARDLDGATIAGTYVRYDQMETFTINAHFLVPKNRTGVASPTDACSK